MTRKAKERRQFKLEWNKAIRESRAVRFNQGESFRSYLSAAEALQAVNAYTAEGLDAEIIDPIHALNA